MHALRQTAQTRQDLFDIWLSIAGDNPAAADRVYDRLEARMTTLQRFPEIGSLRPDIVGGARALVVPPYLVRYRALPDAVQIVCVLHGARLLDSSLFDEGLA